MQNTADDWDGLLGVMTEDELRQYGQVATDQMAQVDNRFPVRLAFLVGCGFLALWGLWKDFTAGIGFATIYWVLPFGLAVYWQYRSVRFRRLWSEHFAVVNGELARRISGMNETGAGQT